MLKERGYLLLVEDEPTLQMLNTEILRQSGYTVKQAYTLSEANKIIKEKMPRGIILDIRLPDGNGFEFLNELRKKSNVPVLILTALDAEEDIIKGLSFGSDDYLTKPYESSVFLARVESMLRRAEKIPAFLETGHFKLYPTSGVALLKGEDLLLSQKEYSVLQLLVQQFAAQDQDDALSNEHLYEKVWMQEMIDNNSLKQTIRKLREKLKNSVYTISNLKNKGYFLEYK